MLSLNFLSVSLSNQVISNANYTVFAIPYSTKFMVENLGNQSTKVLSTN